MDSDPAVPPSQPTQLLQHVLAAQTQAHSWDLASPNGGNIDANDFSLDSRIVPLQPATPRYHLQVSLLQRDSQGSGERVLAENFKTEENRREKVQAEICITSPASLDSIAHSGSDLFPQHGDNSVSASTGPGKAIWTKAVSFQSPGVHPCSRPATSMPIDSKHYRPSPSPPSQDSFGGPVSQDPAEQYLASAKQFNVPLSELGETPTQEVIHSPTDLDVVLPDASEHKELLEAAMHKYDEERANRTASNRRTNILVAATPSNSDESSGASQYKNDGFSFHNRGPELAGQDSRFEFGGSSSFDKMLERGLVDAPDLTSDPVHFKVAEQPHVHHLADVNPPAAEDTLTTPPLSGRQRSSSFEWIAPAPSAAIASSNPRSLLRMVHPANKYRIAKMRNLAGDVEPPSCVTAGAVTQPSCTEETQPYHARAGESTSPNASPSTPCQIKMPVRRPAEHQAQREDEGPEDDLDIVPDSEPLRAGSGAGTPSCHRAVAQSPLKNVVRSFSPISEHGPEVLVPDSLELGDSEADIPLADEIASRNTKRFLAPAEDMAMHSKNEGIASSTVSEARLLVLGKQTQKPTSSSTKGINVKIKLPKTELAEVPTSLPEQDLQSLASSSIQPPAISPDKLPSKKKGSGSRPPKPPHARHTSAMCRPATKSVVGKKRFRKSDAESSEDLSCQPTEDEEVMELKVRGEKEEENNSMDNRGVDSPSLPFPKLGTSYKRRRTEAANLVRGMSNAPTSTRSKRSETPAIMTRSGKRLRSGVSSTRGPTAEPATQVFALWKLDGHYYSGVVYSRGPKNKYVVKFDDGTEDDVELKNIRRQELLIGDRVIVAQDGVRGVVSDVGHARSHGSFSLEIDDGETVITRELEFGDIRIANRTIQNQWKERTVAAENIFTVVRPKPSIDATPSRQSVISTASGKVQKELVKTGFVVTISPKNDRPIQIKEEVMRAIKLHGGLVIEDWSSVFTMEGKHSQSNKRWIAVPQDFRWKSEINLERVFLLSDDAHQKPKFLLALALGIPCISFDWLTKGDKVSSDWQPYLLSAGYSDTLGARLSQLIDLDWGNCTEHLTDIMVSRIPFKLFSQKTVLCIGADLVPLPPNRAKKNTSEEASRYVPWIILCMGASKVEAVADTKQVSLDYMGTFDYIIVKEQSILASTKLGSNVVVGDVTWVKECLVSMRLSPPELDERATRKL